MASHPESRARYQDMGVWLGPALALAASCAFMLPVATPPNAIVDGAGSLTIPQIARAGLLLNLFGIILLSAVALMLAPKVLVGGP